MCVGGAAFTVIIAGVIACVCVCVCVCVTVWVCGGYEGKCTRDRVGEIECMDGAIFIV